jgi:hypothetical protein
MPLNGGIHLWREATKVIVNEDLDHLLVLQPRYGASFSTAFQHWLALPDSRL